MIFNVRVFVKQFNQVEQDWRFKSRKKAQEKVEDLVEDGDEVREFTAGGETFIDIIV